MSPAAVAQLLAAVPWRVVGIVGGTALILGLMGYLSSTLGRIAVLRDEQIPVEWREPSSTIPRVELAEAGGPHEAPWAS